MSDANISKLVDALGQSVDDFVKRSKIKIPEFKLRWVLALSDDKAVPLATIKGFVTEYYKLQQYINGEWVDVEVEE